MRASNPCRAGPSGPVIADRGLRTADDGVIYNPPTDAMVALAGGGVDPRRVGDGGLRGLLRHLFRHRRAPDRRAAPGRSGRASLVSVPALLGPVDCVPGPVS